LQDSGANVSDVAPITELDVPPIGKDIGERNSHLEVTQAKVLVTQEVARVAVLVFLFVCVVGILGFTGWQCTTGNWNNAKDWMLIVLPIITGFLGSALGFYFSVIVSFKDRRG
jgi:TRAP-type C4-dicarboxylate transport system permease small subunit